MKPLFKDKVTDTESFVVVGGICCCKVSRVIPSSWHEFPIFLFV